MKKFKVGDNVKVKDQFRTIDILPSSIFEVIEIISDDGDIQDVGIENIITKDKKNS